MDTLFFIGQLGWIAALAYGAWVCFSNAGKYDAENMRADEVASRRARGRGHSEVVYPPLDLAA